ncbi:U1 small nuclear ribonucleoprotein 70 kDa-like [Mytilus galloprovincialis]|uniref:U1 small nuclear ribonucleoprotein 70 kDa n=1 Tax=Mytilus galloprovincialis TaxID=29158 RepID=A0A8B6CQK7_MYTGA|nr:U1 small nuclear ribonucleoprotein 70kDa [Mytilus galloprovincialis]
MTAFLPPNLLALFAARDPVPYLPPADKLGFEKKRLSYGGVAQFLNEFEDPKDTPPPTRVETKDERKERKRKERAEQIAYKLEQDLALWDPNNNTNGTRDPYKTLFIARINFDTSESKLRREFEVYGPVRKISLLFDNVSQKPRGYAFIEYEHERDMHAAYKHADGKKIDGRRVLVDVERGRTVKGWRPRRLGGGLGGTRKGGPDENTRFSGRDDFRSDREGGRGRDESPRREGERERGTVPERGGGERTIERDRGGDRGGGGDRRRRSRSRDRKRSRSRERPRSRSKERGGDRDEDRKRGRRSRSRERDRGGDRGGDRAGDRDRKRSRSRERKRTRRSRSRDRSRRSRSRERKTEEGEEAPQEDYEDVQVKQEKFDPGYDQFANEQNGGGFQGNIEDY